MGDLTDEDRRAQAVWAVVAPVAELGLAPLAIEALDLHLSRTEALGLVTRLGMLAQHSIRMQTLRAEQARRARALDDAR
jgi:hypothetical protein